MDKNEIKRRNRIRRECSLEAIAARGPQHGKATKIPSAKDKARSRQRRDRSWLRDAA